MSKDLINTQEPEPPETVEPIQNKKNQQPQETGGRDGLDPSRFGDWEKNGRCIDF